MEDTARSQTGEHLPLIHAWRLGVIESEIKAGYEVESSR
jgi:hypothetical protein